MSQPLVSVILPTFNSSAFVTRAVASILEQTLGELELIVVNDGSTDDTQALLAGIADPRLTIVGHASNRGIAAARNSGLEAARGRYIAWLDSDDVSRPTRLAQQVRFLETHTEIALVGGCAGKIAADGRPHGHAKVPPFHPADVRCWLLFKSAFQQSSVMGRASILKDHRYDPSFRVCEDVDVFARLAARHRLANLATVLVDRRMHDAQISRERRGEVLSAQARISAPQLAQLGVEFTHEDLLRHGALARAIRGRPSDEYVAWALDWTGRILEANRDARTFDHASLTFLVNFVRFRLHRGVGRGALGSAVRAGVVSRRGASWLARAASPALRQEFAVRTST